MSLASSSWAVVIPRGHINEVINLLRTKGWLKKGQNVVPLPATTQLDGVTVEAWDDRAVGHKPPVVASTALVALMGREPGPWHTVWGCGTDMYEALMNRENADHEAWTSLLRRCSGSVIFGLRVNDVASLGTNRSGKRPRAEETSDGTARCVAPSQRLQGTAGGGDDDHDDGVAVKSDDDVEDETEAVTSGLKATGVATLDRLRRENIARIGAQGNAAAWGAEAQRNHLRQQWWWHRAAPKNTTTGVPGATAPNPRFTFCELFAGIGGFRFGLAPLGGECIMTSEISAEAWKVYTHNHDVRWVAEGQRPAEYLVGDITELSDDNITSLSSDATPPGRQPPRLDVLTGGFPCQPFSKAGAQRGFDDPRGLLFREILRVLRLKRPAMFLLENVAHLTEMDDGRVLKIIVDALKDPSSPNDAAVGGPEATAAGAGGYRVIHHVVDAALLVPQQRRRVYLLGVSNAWMDTKRGGSASDVEQAHRVEELLRSYPWPGEGAAAPAQDWLPSTPPTLEDALEATGGPGSHLERFALSEAQLRGVQRSGNFRRVRRLRPDATADTPPSDAVPRTPPATSDDVRTAARTLMSSYRHSFSKYSEFVEESATAGGGDRKAPWLRFYSPEECCRLQGFLPLIGRAAAPDDVSEYPSIAFDPTGGGQLPTGATYRLLGNAVVPPVISAVALPMIDALFPPGS